MIYNSHIDCLILTTNPYVNFLAGLRAFRCGWPDPQDAASCIITTNGSMRMQLNLAEALLEVRR